MFDLIVDNTQVLVKQTEQKLVEFVLIDTDFFN